MFSAKVRIVCYEERLYILKLVYRMMVKEWRLCVE